MTLNRHPSGGRMVAFLLICFCFFTLICGECPGGCSGRGTCGAYDMCDCYKNFIGGDCSQRMCQFGLAHVDTPKGDLDASQIITDRTVRVGVWSNLWPQGTTEQYPAMADSSGTFLQNTAHEYSECSNKGICDRTTGECECIVGYEGSACQRASCPGSDGGGMCSGHGVCVSAREWADRDHHNIYELWDADITMGCVCDAGYTGAGCEIKTCKSGVDPLFKDPEGSHRYTNVSYVIYTLEGTAKITGNYSIAFHDLHNHQWKTKPIQYGAPCYDVIDALESIPNDVIPFGSVRCTMWSDYNHIPQSDEPIYFKYSPYHGIKYTLAFPGNPGYLKPIQILRYLDGKRPTLFSSEVRTSTLGVFVYPNGFTGEHVENWVNKCVGVELTLKLQPAVMNGLDHVSEYSYFGDLTLLEQRLLQRCLGDADGLAATKSANGKIEGADYIWDYGNIINPHIVRLVMTTTPSKVVTDLCDRHTDESIRNGSRIITAFSQPLVDGGRSGNKGRTCTYAEPNAGFYGAVYYDPGLNRFKLMNRVSRDYGPTTKFALWTTLGHTQMVSNDVNVYTRGELDEMYSNTVYSINSTDTYQYYTGNVDCETHQESRAGAMACLNRDDQVFFLDTERADRNPEYLNIYSIKKVYIEPNAQIQRPFSRRNRIELNEAINADYLNPNMTWNVRAYKFYPPTSISGVGGGYKYVTECSNRGICRTEEGICECFSQFTLDDCSSVNNFANNF